MQTFLVPPSTLDTARLRKQTVECKQIVIALTEGTGWVHHPATKMWTNHVAALCNYAIECVDEYNVMRGYESTLRDYFTASYWDAQGSDSLSCDEPWWWGHERLVETHESNLIRKLPTFYRGKYESAREGLPYLWPTWDVPGEFKISAAESKRQPLIPRDWQYDPKTRVVSF